MPQITKKPDAANGALENKLASPAPARMRLTVVGPDNGSGQSQPDAGWEPVPDYIQLVIHPDQSNQEISFFRGERLEDVSAKIATALGMPRVVVDSTIVTVAAAALGLRVEVEASESVVLKCLSWLTIISPPGARKTTLCNMVCDPLLKIEREETSIWMELVADLLEEKRDIERQWKDYDARLNKASTINPGAPVRPARARRH
jgi:hypothetical protein